MKNRFSHFLFITLLITHVFSFAQKLPCTTHSRTQDMLEQHPERQALREQLERETAAHLALPKNQRASSVKVIPTVIHIIHDNGSENLSKQTILNAMEVVNEELRAQNGNLSTVVTEFQNIIGDPQFELRLAKIDAWGNCTDGITRTRSSQTYDADDDVKDLINWNDGSRRYLQVWLVNSVAGGAGGYTYLPGSTNSHNNGIIIRAAQFQGSLAHEFGHWTNLSHTWGGTNEPGVSSNCWIDDGINDTPETEGILGSCNLSQETCGSLDNVQNHMDYSTCARMFTADQASAMQAAANSNVGGRNDYWTQSNLSATGTGNGFVAPSCTPQVDFSLDETLGCEGLEVEFDDNLWGADEDPSWTWTWNFPGGTPSTSNEPNPVVTYNTAGIYDVSLTVTSSSGSNSYTMQDAVTVTQFGGGIDAQFEEGMENSSFPDNADPMFEWSIESPGGLTWQRSTSASYSGTASAKINLRSITAGNLNSLISPPIDMSDVQSEDARMSFRLAHSNRNSTNHDERLRVYASKNCGETWTIRYTEDGDDLNTAGGLVSGTFVPDAGDWRQEEVSLLSMAGEEHVLIKFEARSDQQSNLYIDDININPDHSVGMEEINLLKSATIYPNPINGTSQLILDINEGDEFTFTLVDILGKQLSTMNRDLNAGLNRIALNEFDTELNAGFYFIGINTKEGQRTLRFVKN